MTRGGSHRKGDTSIVRLFFRWIVGILVDLPRVSPRLCRDRPRLVLARVCRGYAATMPQLWPNYGQSKTRVAGAPARVRVKLVHPRGYQRGGRARECAVDSRGRANETPKRGEGGSQTPGGFERDGNGSRVPAHLSPGCLASLPRAAPRGLAAALARFRMGPGVSYPLTACAR